MLSREQELFCRYISMGYSKSNSAKYAGYSGGNTSIFSSIAIRLLESKQIQERIMEIQTTMYDVDTTRRDIVGWYKAYDLFEFGSVVRPVPLLDADGNPIVKYQVKSYDMWSPLERALFKGIGKNGLPEFYDKVDAKKELCRIFGLYKENTLSVEEDIDSMFEGAGLNPSIKSKAGAVRVDTVFDVDAENEELDIQLNEIAELERELELKKKSVNNRKPGVKEGIVDSVAKGTTTEGSDEV